jgi:serine/threonine protein kinase
MVDHTGQQFGNYTLTRLLGRGGFAEVYLGEHIYLKSLAAIKVLLTALDQEEIARFLAEARTLAALKHPHIVRILDFGIEKDTPFLVMEYASNGTMQQRHSRGEPLPLDVVVPYVSQIASALQYAHDQKLIHRDIKPGNILLHEQNELLLSDFGVAMFTQDSHQKSNQDFVGTATYMAPEQIRGQACQSSDQYALGVIVYEWLSGGYLFQGTFTEVCTQHMYAPPEPLRNRVPNISPTIEQVVMTTLAKEPSQRFSSVQAFATALEQAYLSEYKTVPSLPDAELQTIASLAENATPAHQSEQTVVPSLLDGEPPTISSFVDSTTPAPQSEIPPASTASQPSHKQAIPFTTTLRTLFSQRTLSFKNSPLLLVLLVVAIAGGGLLYAYAATGRPATAQNRKATTTPTQFISSQAPPTPTAIPPTTSSTQVDLVAAPSPTTSVAQPTATPTPKAETSSTSTSDSTNTSTSDSADTPTPKPTATPTPKPACPPIVQFGSKNAWVKTLQQDLNKRGMTDSAGKALVVDGDFGANTEYAVKKWQKHAQITVDGAVGPETWHSLGRC